MPRFDGSGPQGEGPMTGRGAGYCGPDQAPTDGYTARGVAPRAGFWRPFAWGRRIGRMFRRGRGRGRGRGRW